MTNQDSEALGSKPNELLELAARAHPYRNGTYYFSSKEDRDRFLDLAVSYFDKLAAAPNEQPASPTTQDVGRDAVEAEHEIHMSGDETMGHRFVIDQHLSVYCGEISHRMFEELLDQEQQSACGHKDTGWFIVLYDNSKPRGEQATILARALDMDSGQETAKLIARALRTAPKDSIYWNAPLGPIRHAAPNARK